jgi:hypothetical protein
LVLEELAYQEIYIKGDWAIRVDIVNSRLIMQAVAELDDMVKADQQVLAEH